MNADLLQGFYLGELKVEPLTGQITGGAEPTHLPPKAAEVLLCLAKSPGEIVSRDKLLDAVWGRGNGSQEALGHAVSEIRHALGDHADDPHFIQTLPKRGYRLLITPTPVASAAPTAPKPISDESQIWQMMLRHGVVQAGVAYLVVGWLLIQVADATFSNIGLPAWSEHFVTFVVISGFPILILLAWFLEFAEGKLERDSGTQSVGLFQGLERNYLAIFIAYGLAAVGVATYQALVGFDIAEPAIAVAAADDDAPIPVKENSLAVLKLLNIEGDERSKIFTEGLSEDILDGLARIPGLSVSARGDSWSLPPNAASGDVRRRLRVAHYIEGSVRFYGDKLRVVIQLINSTTGFHIFSRGFEVDISDIGKMQTEITKLVVANMKLTVDPSKINFDSYYANAASDDAYYQFRLGRDALARPRSRANIDEALEHFDRALQIDDRYPAALAGRCRAYTSLYQMEKNADDIARAETACSSALDVAPQLGVVLNTAARLYQEMGRQQEASMFFTRALELDAQDAVATQGMAAIMQRAQKFDEAEQLMRRAIDLQPGNWNVINALGNMYFRTGRFVEAVAEYRKVVYLDPENFVTLGNLASANLMLGDFAAARDALQQTIRLQEDPTFQANLGVAHYYLGDFEKAVTALRRAVELAPNSAGNWVALADALHFSVSEAEANSAYQEAIKLARDQLGVNRDDTESLTYLSWASAMTGQHDEALALATRAVELDPADPFSHYFDALAKFKSGDFDAAVAALERAKDAGYPLAMLSAEPILKELHDNSRFAKLLASEN